MSRPGRIVVATALLLGSCAAPPLTLYTLGTPATASNAAPLGKTPIVVAVARVTVPDELDTEDIVVRDGSTLRRSRLGRWSNRLSLAITDRLTERLAARYPGALVTDRPLAETPSDRVLVNIGRLDVTASGGVTLDADWLVVPRDAARPTRRDRAHFSATGPVATDQDVVTLVGFVLDQLAGAIGIPASR
jgi:uncharacterized protein